MNATADKADAERKLCRDWLLSIMRASPVKTRTKADLRAEAIACFKVSKVAFDVGWDWAIMETGNEHWWEPLRGSKKALRPTSRMH